MRNFNVIFVRCCPCFIEVISNAMVLEKGLCFTSVEFSDSVSSEVDQSFAIETFQKSSIMLFTCFTRLVSCFAFDTDTCLCYFKKTTRTFFTCKAEDDREIIRRGHVCYRKSIKMLICDFSLFVR